jgi:hypothetical protein
LDEAEELRLRLEAAAAEHAAALEERRLDFLAETSELRAKCVYVARAHRGARAVCVCVRRRERA